MTAAVKWSGRIDASEPLIFPIGVRQASTAYTAVIGCTSSLDTADITCGVSGVQAG
jgi:hypothetical protein